MKIFCCEGQNLCSLNSFYEELAERDNAVWKSAGEAMLGLLKNLHSHPDNKQVYGLISNYMLCFLSENNCNSPRFVTITTPSKRRYHIEFLMPKATAPWRQPTFVRGETHSESEAIEMIIIAMEQSGGWASDEPEHYMAPK